MKRIMLVAALALAAGSQALAADLPPPMAPPPPQAPATYVPVTGPVYNWGGIYLGVNGGYGFGNSDWTPSAGTSTGNFNVSGGLAGGTIGANFQASQFVFGIEADGDWSDINGSTNTANPPCPSTCQTKNDWLATVRGRVGYAFDRILVFATAGGAFGDIKSTLSAGTTAAMVPFAGGSNTSSEFGWTAGAGLEYGITENWTARVEYLFVDLSNGSCTTACVATVANPNLTNPTTVKFDASLIRAGVNFKFNGF